MRSIFSYPDQTRVYNKRVIIWKFNKIFSCGLMRVGSVCHEVYIQIHRLMTPLFSLIIFVGMMKSKTTAMTLHWVSWMNFYLWTWSQSYKKQTFVRILLSHGQLRQRITLTCTDEYSREGEYLWKKFKDEILFFVSSEYFHLKRCLTTVWGLPSRIWCGCKRNLIVQESDFLMTSPGLIISMTFYDQVLKRT